MRLVHSLSIAASCTLLSLSPFISSSLSLHAAESSLLIAHSNIRSVHSDPVAPIGKEQNDVKIQIAILLDNSGSMSGLIDQAKSQIWSLVNEFIGAQQNGKNPRIEVSVWTYGSPPPKMLIKLSGDLDRVSEELFAISIDGGSEYCGQVIENAVNELQWSQRAQDLKVIFIAGNEAFSQGPVDYRKSCPTAYHKGIVINTIHCGSGIPDGWLAGALLANGHAMNIDQNYTVQEIATPYDQEIIRLNTELNTTYIGYGKRGTISMSNQVVQDRNSARSSMSSFSSRAQCKSNSLYDNKNWDLVDAYRNNKSILDTIAKNDLPKELQGKSTEDQLIHIHQKQILRLEIQKKMNQLNSQRSAFIAVAKKENNNNNNQDLSLDAAMKKVVVAQAEEKGFTFAAKNVGDRFGW